MSALSPEQLSEISHRAAYLGALAVERGGDLTLGVTTDVIDLVNEVERLRDELADRPSRAEALREAAEVATKAARAQGDSEVGQYASSVAAVIGRQLRELADAAEQGETGGA